MLEVSAPQSTAIVDGERKARLLAHKGFSYDAHYGIVPVPLCSSQASTLPGAFIFRGLIDQGCSARIESDPDVIKIWPDEPLDQFPLNKLRRNAPCPIPPCNCRAGSKAQGDFAEVASHLRIDQIWNLGYAGDGIVVGIVDCGICAFGRPVRPPETAVVPNVIGGYPLADWGTTSRLSTIWADHGNMTATDVLAMAPKAKLYDIRITDSFVGSEGVLLSNAMAAIDWAIARHRIDGTPHILSNSWGLHQPLDQPCYANDPQHPLTRKYIEAIDEGILVLFSAGNCGPACPAQYCQDTGNGFHILGANGHPRVMTIGAVTLRGELAGYSSAGPSSFDPQKPDFCSITQFKGYYPRHNNQIKCDPGTSSATAIAAGAIALIKQGYPSLNQSQMKSLLKSTAKVIGPGPFNRFTGAGLIQPKMAWDRLSNC